jgi:hypothetical protein
MATIKRVLFRIEDVETGQKRLEFGVRGVRRGE